jgi:hypothetical protein
MSLWTVNNSFLHLLKKNMLKIKKGLKTVKSDTDKDELPS